LNNKGTAIILIYLKKKSKVLGVLSLIRNFASRYGIYAELQREIAGAGILLVRRINTHIPTIDSRLKLYRFSLLSYI
jgi:Tfp pilus assembly ATPase PilU